MVQQVKNNMKKHEALEQPYLDLLNEVLTLAKAKDDRTGVGTISVFGRQIRFDLSKGFPLITTKKVFMRGIIHELLWIIRGSSNIKYLVDNNVNIWNDWPYRNFCIEYGKISKDKPLSQEEFIEKIKNDISFAKKWGELGPVYGVQWRKWQGKDGELVDQLASVIDQIKKNPTSRRLIVSAWNAAEIDKMVKSGLPPCHTLFQFYVQDNKLSCQLYQRSADLFLGVPFNIASYALLTHLIANVCGLQVGEFIHTFGDAHIYLNHIDQVKLQLSRKPFSNPTISINHRDSIDDFVFEDIVIHNYQSHPAIKGEVAV